VIDEACAEWKISHKAGPMFWLRKHTATENYQWKEQGTESGRSVSVEAVAEGFCEDRLRGFSRSSTISPRTIRQIISMCWSATCWRPRTSTFPRREKCSRRGLVVGFITWFCQFYPSTGWIGQSEDDLKAQGLIKYANIAVLESEALDEATFTRSSGAATKARSTKSSGKTVPGSLRCRAAFASSHRSTRMGTSTMKALTSRPGERQSTS
jgi:hypothetical protein